MKVINISGDNQSGRTHALISFVESQALDFNSKCLVVCPTNERATMLRKRCRLVQGANLFNNVKFIGSSSFNMDCISSIIVLMAVATQITLLMQVSIRKKKLNITELKKRWKLFRFIMVSLNAA